MTRRNFIQQLVITLLTIILGPELVANLTEDELENCFTHAEDSWQVGDYVTITGSGNNNGTYKIVAYHEGGGGWKLG